MEDGKTEPHLLDVIIIGAGFSGLCAAIGLLKRSGVRFRILEKTGGIGGTWWLNTYPGAACDVPSHFYCFSFFPNPNWSRVYSPHDEIQRYLEECAVQFDLASSIEFSAEVSELRFEAASGTWRVTMADGRELKSRFVINGTGALHRPMLPGIEGQDRFGGPVMHTAQWDPAVLLRGRRVAMIGSAASAIQVAPEIAGKVSSLEIFQRTPNYIAPRHDRRYSAREKRRFARWPWFTRVYRWCIAARMEWLLFRIVKRDSWLGRLVAVHVNRLMRKTVTDPGLRRKLTPDYAIGCKRILLSDDYFATLNRNNVALVTDRIRAIEPGGVRTVDDELHTADVLIYATGFDVDGHIRALPVFGDNGQSLGDAWAAGAEAYYGTCVAGFPNFFLATGPNTGVGTTSMVHMIEQTVGFILRLIDMTGSAQTVAVRPEAQTAYNARLQSALAGTVWSSGCSSWYIGANGRISTLYPWNGRRFERQLGQINHEDFIVKPVSPAAAATAVD